MTAAQAEPGRPPAEAPIIELRGVTKVYGEGALAFQALRGVDLRIAQGDFVISIATLMRHVRLV